MDNYLTIHNLTLHYRIVGEGKQTVLLLHGNKETMSVYDDFIALLSKQYRFVLMDSRGHGKSKLNGQPLTLDWIKNDALKLMELLNIEEYSVFGVGDGANVALMMGLETPNIKSMVLVSPNLSFKSLKWHLKTVLLTRCFCLAPLCLYHPGARLEWKKSMLMIKEPKLTLSQLQTIKIPTLLFSGQYDLIKQSHFQDISSHLPFCKYCEIKHASHYMIQPLEEKLLKETQIFLDCLD